MSKKLENKTLGIENKTANSLEQSNISEHSKTQFKDMIFESLKTGGLNACAFKGHGKTRFLFSIASELMKSENVRVLIFDSSDAWLYGFNRIGAFNVSNIDISMNERKSTEDLEKYQLNNWLLVKFALNHNKDLLFRMKTRNPNKRAFFIRTIINYIDTLQRAEKERSPEHENKQAIAFFLEEAQNTFNSRSTSSNDALEFLSVFNEGRNFKESFFTACQRLNDFSKTIRTKQLQLIGKLSSEDLSPNLRKLEKALKIDFSAMPLRHWVYEGKLFVSPEFKQEGKPYLINRSNKEAWLNAQPKPERKKTLAQKIKAWLNPTETAIEVRKSSQCQNQNSFFENEEDIDRNLRNEEENDLREIEEEWLE